MPLFAMLSSCNMLFDSSKHCNLMLISAKSELLLFAILPCVFEHVLVIFGDNSVFMFFYAYLYIMTMPFVFILWCCSMLF